MTSQLLGSRIGSTSCIVGFTLLLALPVGCADDDEIVNNPGGGSAGTSAGRGSGGSSGSEAGAGGARAGANGKGGSPAEGGSSGNGVTGGDGVGGSSTGGTGGSSTGGTGGSSAGGTGGSSAGGTGGVMSSGGKSTGGAVGIAGSDSAGAAGEHAGASGEQAGAGGAVDVPPPPLKKLAMTGGWISEQYPDGEGAPKAFDGDHQTKWLTFNTTSWIQRAFDAQTAVVDSYVLVSANDADDRDPRTWALLANNSGPDANDADDSEWQVLDSRTNQGPFPERNAPYTYTIANPGGYKFYRLRIDANNGSSDIIQLSEIELYAGATKVTGSGHVTEQYAKSNEGPQSAFDGDHGTKWLTGNATSWIQYEFPAVTHAVEVYNIVSGNDADDRDPRDWVLLGNNTGPDANDSSDSEWTELDKRTGQGPFPERNQTYTFTAAHPGAFRFYRLKVSANNGASILQLSEIELLAR